MPTTDPTRTKTLRDAFGSDANKRFRAIKGDVREVVEELDVLQLGSQRAVNSAPDPRDYQFLSNSEKRQRFQAWLREQIDNGVLEPTDGDAFRRGEHWTAQYVQKAYAKGVTDAGAKIRQQGGDVQVFENLEDVFNQPVHSSKIELVYVRAYDGLEGITQEMDTQISRELSNAISEGWNPRKAAREINDRVDAIGMTRAQTLSQTEIIHAHAEGTLDRFESEGFTEVEADVEHHTAGDSRVCPKCASLQGNTYTLREARGRIPVHPRCRCTWVPIVNN
ncbi:minor capsid protein [Halorubrum ezzemoulense]|uniref:minor capsid protein n=1 Tax=Halorubrum ezzemoulense TaxID=337243 RepID=UPI00232BB70E|nr:minor capsid protein [Halorubrum ezzemoulense]MDB2225609.1 minor capsid protein [Halorubrum ezzemoulense]